MRRAAPILGLFAARRAVGGDKLLDWRIFGRAKAVRLYRAALTANVTRLFSPYEQGRWVCCLLWNRNRPGIKIMKATAATQYSLDVPKATSVAGNPILGTWKLQSLVFEAIETGQRSSPFGDHPVGYLGYSPDGRMLPSTGK
jgi:Lipocalin-like domain